MSSSLSFFTCVVALDALRLWFLSCVQPQQHLHIIIASSLSAAECAFPVVLRYTTVYHRLHGRAFSSFLWQPADVSVKNQYCAPFSIFRRRWNKFADKCNCLKLPFRFVNTFSWYIIDVLIVATLYLTETPCVVDVHARKQRTFPTVLKAAFWRPLQIHETTTPNFVFFLQ